MSECDSHCSNKVLDHGKYRKHGLCIDDGAGWKWYADPLLYDVYYDRRKRYDIVFATKPLCFHNLESNDEGAVTVTEEPKQRDEVVKIEKTQPQGVSDGGGGKDEKKKANTPVVSTEAQEKEEIIDNNSEQRNEVTETERTQSQGVSGGGGDSRNQNGQANITVVSTGAQEQGEEELTPSFVDDDVMYELTDAEQERLNTQVADLFNDTIENVKAFCNQKPAELECAKKDSVIRSLEQLKGEVLKDLSAQ